MKHRYAAVAGIGLLGALAFALPGAAGGNKYDDSTVERDCGDGDTVTLVGPLKLWPPNHKMVDEAVTAVDGSGDGVTLTLTITPTDVAGGDGGTQHDPDYNPEPAELVASGSGDTGATVPFALRAERSGKGDGRTYTIDWVAEFDNGGKTCESETDAEDGLEFVIAVPHDMRGGADWK